MQKKTRKHKTKNITLPENYKHLEGTEEYLTAALRRNYPIVKVLIEMAELNPCGSVLKEWPMATSPAAAAGRWKLCIPSLSTVGPLAVAPRTGNAQLFRQQRVKSIVIFFLFLSRAREILDIFSCVVVNS